MRPTLHFVVLLLCCVTGSFAAAEHRCCFEELERKVGPRTTAVVLELPTRERAMIRALTASVVGWAPIRFKVFTEDMENPLKYCTAMGESRPDFIDRTLVCRNEDIFTAEKKSIILNSVLPQALKMHTDRLLVRPVTGYVVVPEFAQGICAKFTIPKSHHTVGVSGADMFLYVAAGPTEDGTLAWAITCSQLNDGRPILGMLNFGPGSVSDSEHSVRILVHEIAHVLGFSALMMKERNMSQVVRGVRGKAEVHQVSSPNTVKKTREHFNCMNATGMELEDEGGTGTALSHWKRRNAKDELMAGISGIGYYTALTMAFFEDTGFYKAKWGTEEPMSWGKNSGCALLTEKCLTNGVTKLPDMFCNSENGRYSCTSDRLAVGYCALYLYDKPLPSEYQYFTNNRIGGPSQFLMDYCPYVQPYTNTWCSRGASIVMPGSRIGPRSKCLKGDGLGDFMGPIGDVCAEVSCEKGEVSVRYLGDETWYKCPEGSSITPTGLFTEGKILCPKYDDVCIVFDGRTHDQDVSNFVSTFPSISVILLVLILIAMP